MGVLLVPSGVILAQEGNGNGPFCALAGYGPVECPPNIVTPGDQGCWARDPRVAGSTWKRISNPPCERYAEFKKPAALVCERLANPNDPDARSLCDPALTCTGDQCNVVKKYLNPSIKVLAAVVGIAVTLSIVWAGIQYASSADDPQRVAAAKRRIVNAVLTLVGFFLLFAFLNWIIPGGIDIP